MLILPFHSADGDHHDSKLRGERQQTTWEGTQPVSIVHNFAYRNKRKKRNARQVQPTLHTEGSSADVASQASVPGTRIRGSCEAHLTGQD